MSAFEIVPLTESHRADWDRLYAGYAEFYMVEQTQEMRDLVWGWIRDPAHEVEGIVALRDGAPIGFAHYRPFARPLMAALGGFLDDLYVDPSARGSGVAEDLIQRVCDIGKERGWTLIRWITQDHNYRARGLYDRVATRTHWITYDIKQ
jgi:GNAT superfamily N-acetyltransferase